VKSGDAEAGTGSTNTWKWKAERLKPGSVDFPITETIT